MDWFSTADPGPLRDYTMRQAIDNDVYGTEGAFDAGVGEFERQYPDADWVEDIGALPSWAAWGSEDSEPAKDQPLRG